MLGRVHVSRRRFYLQHGCVHACQVSSTWQSPVLQHQLHLNLTHFKCSCTFFNIFGIYSTPGYTICQDSDIEDTFVMFASCGKWVQNLNFLEGVFFSLLTRTCWTCPTRLNHVAHHGQQEVGPGREINQAINRVIGNLSLRHSKKVVCVGRNLCVPIEDFCL